MKGSQVSLSLSIHWILLPLRFLPYSLAVISRFCAPSPQSTLSHNGIPPTKTRPRSAERSQELLSLSISMDTASLECLAYSLAIMSRSLELETITPFLQQVVIIDKKMWRTPKNHYPWLSQWILLLLDSLGILLPSCHAAWGQENATIVMSLGVSFRWCNCRVVETITNIILKKYGNFYTAWRPRIVTIEFLLIKAGCFWISPIMNDTTQTSSRYQINIVATCSTSFHYPWGVTRDLHSRLVCLCKDAFVFVFVFCL
jgi:hypothetical protein